MEPCFVNEADTCNSEMQSLTPGVLFGFSQGTLKKVGEFEVLGPLSTSSAIDLGSTLDAPQEKPIVVLVFKGVGWTSRLWASKNVSRLHGRTIMQSSCRTVGMQLIM